MKKIDKFDLDNFNDSFFDDFDLDTDLTADSPSSKGPGKWIKNSLKSIGRSTIEASSSLFPETSNLIKEIGAAGSELRWVMSDQKSKIMDFISKGQSSDKSLKDHAKGFLTGLKDELAYRIRSGDLDGQEKMQEEMMASFGSYGDEPATDENTPRKPRDPLAASKLRLSKIKKQSNLFGSSNKKSIEFLTTAINGGNEAVIATNSEIFNQTQILEEARHRTMLAINKNMATNLYKSTSIQLTLLRMTQEFDTKSLAMQKELLKLTKDYHSIMMSIYNPKEDPYKNQKRKNSAFEVFGNGLSGANWLQGVIQNGKDMLNSSPLGMMLGMAPMLTQMMGGGKNGMPGMSPISMMLSMFNPFSMFINMTSNSKTKKQIYDMEKMFKSIPLQLNQMFNSWATGGTGLKQKIGELLGMRDQQTVASVEKFTNMNLDSPAKFDVRLYRTISEVIPAQLAQIVAGVTGKEETRYDFRSQSFKTISGIRREQKLSEESAFNDFEYKRYADRIKGKALEKFKTLDTKTTKKQAMDNLHSIERQIVNLQVPFTADQLDPESATFDKTLADRLTVNIKDERQKIEALKLFLSGYNTLNANDKNYYKTSTFKVKHNLNRNINYFTESVMNDLAGGGSVITGTNLEKQKQKLRNEMEMRKKMIKNRYSNIDLNVDYMNDERFKNLTYESRSAKRFQQEQLRNLLNEANTQGLEIDKLNDIDSSFVGASAVSLNEMTNKDIINNKFLSVPNQLKAIFELLVNGIIVYPQQAIPKRHLKSLKRYTKYFDKENKKVFENIAREKQRDEERAKILQESAAYSAASHEMRFNIDGRFANSKVGKEANKLLQRLIKSGKTVGEAFGYADYADGNESPEFSKLYDWVDKQKSSGKKWWSKIINSADKYLTRADINTKTNFDFSKFEEDEIIVQAETSEEGHIKQAEKSATQGAIKKVYENVKNKADLIKAQATAEILIDSEKKQEIKEAITERLIDAANTSSEMLNKTKSALHNTGSILKDKATDLMSNITSASGGLDGVNTRLDKIIEILSNMNSLGNSSSNSSSSSLSPEAEETRRKINEMFNRINRKATFREKVEQYFLDPVTSFILNTSSAIKTGVSSGARGIFNLAKKGIFGTGALLGAGLRGAGRIASGAAKGTGRFIGGAAKGIAGAIPGLAKLVGKGLLGAGSLIGGGLKGAGKVTGGALGGLGSLIGGGVNFFKNGIGSVLGAGKDAIFGGADRVIGVFKMTHGKAMRILDKMEKSAPLTKERLETTFDHETLLKITAALYKIKPNDEKISKLSDGELAGMIIRFRKGQEKGSSFGEKAIGAAETLGGAIFNTFRKITGGLFGKKNKMSEQSNRDLRAIRLNLERVFGPIDESDINKSLKGDGKTNIFKKVGGGIANMITTPFRLAGKLFGKKQAAGFVDRGDGSGIREGSWEDGKRDKAEAKKRKMEELNHEYLAITASNTTEILKIMYQGSFGGQQNQQSGGGGFFSNLLGGQSLFSVQNLLKFGKIGIIAGGIGLTAYKTFKGYKDAYDQYKNGDISKGEMIKKMLINAYELNPIFVNPLTKWGKNLAVKFVQIFGKMLTKLVSHPAVSKFVGKQFTNQFMRIIAQGAAKASVQLASRIGAWCATATASVGTSLIVQAALGFPWGMARAKSYFPEGTKITLPMRITAGLVKALDFMSMGIVGTLCDLFLGKSVVQIVWEIISKDKEQGSSTSDGGIPNKKWFKIRADLYGLKNNNAVEFTIENRMSNGIWKPLGFKNSEIFQEWLTRRFEPLYQMEQTLSGGDPEVLEGSSQDTQKVNKYRKEFESQALAYISKNGIKALTYKSKEGSNDKITAMATMSAVATQGKTDDMQAIKNQATNEDAENKAIKALTGAGSLGAFAATFEGAKQITRKIGDAAATKWATVKDWTREKLSLLQEKWGKLKEFLSNSLSKFKDNTKEFLSNTWDKTKEGAQWLWDQGQKGAEWLGNAYNNVKEKAGELLNKGKEKFSQAYDIVKDKAGAVKVGALKFGKSVVEGAAKGIDWVKTNLKKFITGATVDGMRPGAKYALAGMAEDYYNKYKQKLLINSGYRDIKKQAELRWKHEQNVAAEKAGKKKPYPGIGPAALPKTTAPHIAGIAVDINRDQVKLLKSSGIMDKWGWYQPIYNPRLPEDKDEFWHLEVKGPRFLSSNGRSITEQSLVDYDKTFAHLTDPKMAKQIANLSVGGKIGPDLDGESADDGTTTMSPANAFAEQMSDPNNSSQTMQNVNGSTVSSSTSISSSSSSSGSSSSGSTSAGSSSYSGTASVSASTGVNGMSQTAGNVSDISGLMSKVEENTRKTTEILAKHLPSLDNISQLLVTLIQVSAMASKNSGNSVDITVDQLANKLATGV